MPQMSGMIQLSCPSCGAKLKITSDMDRFACIHCGTEVLVKRGEDTISLSPVVDAIRRVQHGVDRTAAELAIARLRDDLRELDIEFDSESKKIERLLVIKVALKQVRCDRLANLDIQGYREMLYMMGQWSFLFKKVLYWVLHSDLANAKSFHVYSTKDINKILTYCCDLRALVLTKQVEMSKYKKMVE
jgi:predicted RNA-binding Zn-ribbon protein involved in translation (DUF1610 family)